MAEVDDVCLAGYAVLNFIVFVNLLGTIGGKRPDEIMSIVFRGVSGEWMAFYSVALLIFYSARRQLKRTEKNSTSSSLTGSPPRL